MLTILISCRCSSFCQSETGFSYDHELSSDTVFTSVYNGLNLFFLSDSTFISSYDNDSYRNHYVFSEMIGAYSIKSNNFILYPSQKEFLPISATVKMNTDSLENHALNLNGQINFIASNSGLSFTHFLGEDDFSIILGEWDNDSYSYDLRQNETLRFRIPIISDYIFELPVTTDCNQIFIEFTGLGLERFNSAECIDKKLIFKY